MSDICLCCRRQVVSGHYISYMLVQASQEICKTSVSAHCGGGILKDTPCCSHVASFATIYQRGCADRILTSLVGLSFASAGDRHTDQVSKGARVAKQQKDSTTVAQNPACRVRLLSMSSLSSDSFTRCEVPYPLHHTHPIAHAPKDGMLAVQPGRHIQRDEELRRQAFCQC